MCGPLPLDLFESEQGAWNKTFVPYHAQATLPYPDNPYDPEQVIFTAP